MTTNTKVPLSGMLSDLLTGLVEEDLVTSWDQFYEAMECAIYEFAKPTEPTLTGKKKKPSATEITELQVAMLTIAALFKLYCVSRRAKPEVHDPQIMLFRMSHLVETVASGHGQPVS